MAKQERKDKTPVSRLRFSIMDDSSHKELFCFGASRNNAILAAILGVLAIMGVTYCLFAFTGLRHAIPGYPSAQTKMLAMANAAKIDSLENVMGEWEFQIENIQRIATGRIPLTADSVASPRTRSEVSEDEKVAFAQNDSILRDRVRQTELAQQAEKARQPQIEGLHFYPPVKGIVTDGFNRLLNHPYIDIAAPENTPVCAVLDGTVISAEWSDRYGYTLQIQHSSDIVSIYRHAEKLLRSAGDKVTAGTPVAVVGNTGELTSGTHLHFELWHKGEAVDPARYISF